MTKAPASNPCRKITLGYFLVIRVGTDLNIAPNDKQNTKQNGKRKTSLDGATNAFANRFANPTHSRSCARSIHQLSVFLYTSKGKRANVFAGLYGTKNKTANVRYPVTGIRYSILFFYFFLPILFNKYSKSEGVILVKFL